MKDQSGQTSFKMADLPKLLVTILAVTLISLFFPAHNEGNLTHSMNGVWTHSDLIAESSFKKNISLGIEGDSLDPLRKIQVNYNPGDIIGGQNQ